MATLLLNKPCGMLSRFTSDGSKNAPLSTLAHPLPRDVWPIGRLDADSEGLLVLSSRQALVKRLLDPAQGHPRTYWVQVEGLPQHDAIAALCDGVVIDGRRTRKAIARVIEGEPALWPRDPPIRHRLTVPTSWLALALVEGRNRQVRRMTAAVGHPTLRLVRAAIGTLTLLGLAPGAHRELTDAHIEQLLTPPRSGLVMPHA